MPAPSFQYQDTFPLGPDETEYRKLSAEGVSTAEFAGREILKVAPEALAYLAQHANPSAGLKEYSLDQALLPAMEVGKPDLATGPQAADFDGIAKAAVAPMALVMWS